MSATAHNPLGPLVHELRSALAIVVHGGQLLGDEVLGPLSPRQAEVVNMLRANSHKIQLLVDYLSACDRWRERGVQAEADTYALKPLVERCVQRYRQLGAAHRIGIGLSCDEAQIRIGHAAMQLVIDGLLAHALQFAPEGSDVSLSVMFQPTVPAALTIEVRDRGPALDAESRISVFATASGDLLAWKGASPPPRAGLELVRICVEAHGGTVQSIAAATDGAGFRVHLPLP